MRYKVAPGPVDWDTLAGAHRAVPLVPGSTDDCCARLQSRLDLPARDAASEWLAFLDALELARETDRGYERVRTDLAADALAPRFRERVFGVPEILETLASADGPLTAEQTFEQVSEMVPTWERNRHSDWTAVWGGRVERLLAWAVLLELVERRSDGFTL